MVKLVEFVKGVWVGLMNMLKTLIASAKEITNGIVALLPMVLLVLGLYNLIFKGGKAILGIIDLLMSILSKVGVTPQIVSVALIVLVGWKVLGIKLK